MIYSIALSAGMRMRSIESYHDFNYIRRILNQDSIYHDDVIKWKHFLRYRVFVRGIHWSQRRVTQSFDVFLSAPEQTVEQTIQALGIWDAIALITINWPLGDFNEISKLILGIDGWDMMMSKGNFPSRCPGREFWVSRHSTTISIVQHIRNCQERVTITCHL